ncbi:unnamed protein product [Closterium sp. NIES-54]
MSHPWVFSLLPDGRCLGFLADTTRRCEVDLRAAPTLSFTASAPFPLILFGPSASPSHLLQLLAKAIGPLPLPARWVLGYQQCRFSYESAARVEEVAKTFREKKIPCDVMWMDIDYMDGYRSFSFDPVTYPDPLGLARFLNEAGFKAIWMLDPGIKEEQGYGPVESGDAADVWILNAEGKPFVGDVWPGPCKFPDYTMQRAREWWRDMVADFAKEGVDGIWNDMNEPTVFRAVNKTMPDDNIHRGDDDMGGTQNHLHYHNVYGMLMARATSEGLEKALPDKRPFVLTRAGFIGSQRYAASWTGDNLATWEYLHMSVPMALNMVRHGVVRYGVVRCRMVGDVASGFIGSQRYAASWTGDNLATWEYLHMSVPMALNMVRHGVVRYGVMRCRMVGDVASGFIGSQRYVASWTGDNLAT